MSIAEAWGQLVSLTDFETPPILLMSTKFVIGRSEDCQLSIPENRLVSGHHCIIQKDEAGSVSLSDNSTNGTLLNMTYKITKGKSKELQHGDEFYVVYTKDNPSANVGFVYQDMRELEREEGTQEYSPPTLMDATLEDADCNFISEANNSNKRTSDEDDIVQPPAKKQKTEETKVKPCDRVEKSGEHEVDCDKLRDTSAGKDSDIAKGKCTKEASKACEAPGVKTDKVQCDAPSSEAGASDSKATKPAPVPERDDIEENLQCMICQEIMHDCISLQPCLHSFCAGCYSDWMSRSNECPSCRKKVERINKNHIINNLIEAYLKEHPAKKRPDEDLKELNAKNKITNDMLYPKNQMQEESSYYSDTEGSDSPDSVSEPPVVYPAVPQPVLFGIGTPVFGAQRAFKTVCRQCPEYRDPLKAEQNTQNTGLLGSVKTAVDTVKKLITGGGDVSKAADTEDKVRTLEAGPSHTAATSEASTSGEAMPVTSKDDMKNMPVAPVFVCAATQNHVLCQCCFQPMPDFRSQPQNAPPDPRPQQCSICYRAFCHAYWGCRKADCLGCLNKFRDMNFGRKALVGLILDNPAESDIFRDYLDARGLTVRDVLGECCRQLDAGRFTVTAQGTHGFSSERATCYACGMNVFKQLAFQYRKTIKKEDFPEDVQRRPDCYWGSKCRTQKNKPHHAKNFNHICDQTRQY